MRVGIYCRLSDEDHDKLNPAADSESIQNQKSMLARHAVEQGWDIYDIYSDEDYAGSDRERPAFNRLLCDAQRGRLDIVLCKTQSRFSRELEIVEKYIHGLFPEWGVRFIGLVDNADTAIKGNKKSRQINGLINEWYLEDLSDNIRAVLDNKRLKGQYIGAFAPYGYRKADDDRNRLVIDPPAAQVVRRIYQMYLQGMGLSRIAQTLTQEGVPNPTEYKRRQGLNAGSGELARRGGAWTTATVLHVLRNPVYSGTLAQGKQRKVSYKSKRRKTVAKELWFVVENAHEAIIDRDTWQPVQAALDRNHRPQKNGEVRPLAGKLFCGQCGRALHAYTVRGRRYSRCPGALKGGPCSGASIPLRTLEERLLGKLNDLAGKLIDEAMLADALTQGDTQERQRQALATELAQLDARLSQLERAQYSLYLDKAKGTLAEELFLQLSQRMGNERQALQERRVAVVRGLDALDQQTRQGSGKADLIGRYRRFETLTRDLALQFIQRVEVFHRDRAGNTPVHIHWSF